MSEQKPQCLSRLLLVFCVSALPGCASLTYESLHQYVLVRSEPEGADIYSGDEKVGVTPAYIEIHRATRAELTLKTSIESKNLSLKSRYRWESSFWPNFVFVTFAPLGWAMDLVSGGAWQMLNPEVTAIRMKPGSDLPPAFGQKNLKSSRVAIS